MVARYSDLEGKTVVVTGGGTGIGAAIVRGFAAQGAKVGFIDIQAEPSEALVQELTAKGQTARFQQADITVNAALTTAIDRIRGELGPIAILVNNAAHDQRHDVDAVDETYYDSRIAVNFKHVFFASQAVLPDMRSLGGGVIVNFSSITWIGAMRRMPLYMACKAAVVGLTRSMARDFGADGIRVNAVAPGAIMTERQMRERGSPAEMQNVLDKQCLKRILYPEDVARFVVFLASDEASAVTSQHMVVDGGYV